MRTPQAITYSTAAFRREREADWLEFETLLHRLERGSLSRLSDDDLLALPRCYRTTLSSLSIARATSLDAARTEYLEALAMRGYFLLYGVRESRARRMVEFFRAGWPQAVAALWRETIIIAVALVLGVAISWSLVASDASWYHSFVPADAAQGRVPGASAATLRETIFGAPTGDSAMHVFAVYLFTHNSQVGILAYALGFAFGVPSLLLIFYQGLMMGPMLAVFSAAGLGVDFAGWLAIHGTTELFACVLAGAAGLRIGTAVAFPGPRDRLGAAADAGKASGAAMVGVIIMLLVAGLLEGFARQLVQDTVVRFSVGGAMLLFWLAYFYTPRRKMGGRPA
ncbi:MAG: stage II sporulation protein M [Sphingopyxis sp.]